MCLAYPGTVVEVSGHSAMVTYPVHHCKRPGDLPAGRQVSPHNSDTTKQVLLGDTKVKIGDHVLVQMGIVIKVISKKESKVILEAWASLN